MDATAPLTPELRFDARGALRRLPGLRFARHAAAGAQRAQVEEYIRARFAGRHGACVTHFLPELLTLGSEGQYCAAVGLARAADGPLFAEVYLDAPVEDAIAARTGEAAQREQILEIGNLVSTWRGSSLLLFVFLSEVIDRLGFRWVVFTATREVEALLARLGYAPVALAQADPARLPDGGAAWGGYYRNRPRVVFGEVRPAVAAARRGVLYRTAARLIERQVERVCRELRGDA